MFASPRMELCKDECGAKTSEVQISEASMNDESTSRKLMSEDG